MQSATKKSVISVKKDVMSGTPVFEGTRVPVKALFDYLEGGQTIEEFLDQYPSVTREQVLDVLKESHEKLLNSVA